MNGPIARSLEDGWDYSPDWRNRVVEKYLIDKAGMEDPREAIAAERDTYVRQFYIFRRTGHCQQQPAFLWAYRTHQNNKTAGAASLIKAMVVAQMPVKAIAARLKTTVKAITFFTKLYFDIERYEKDRVWLASVLFPAGGNQSDLATLREQRWVGAAFLGGHEALARAVNRNMTIDTEEQERLNGEIRAVLTVRAHDFVTGLQNNFVPPGAEDLDRLAKMLEAKAREPRADNTHETMHMFLQAFHGSLVEKARQPEFANDPAMQAVLHKGDSPEVTPEDDGLGS